MFARILLLAPLCGVVKEAEGLCMREALIKRRGHGGGGRRGSHGSCLAIVSLILLLLQFNCAWAAVTDLAYEYCNGNTYSFASTSAYIPNFRAVKSALLTQASQRLYSKASSTLGESTSDFMYGVYQCRGDVSLAQCYSCVSYALDVTLLCDRWRHQHMGCYVRYDYVPFYDEEDSLTFWNGSCSAVPDSSTLFQSNIATALEIVTTSAAEKGGFYVSRVGTGASTVYVLGQCVGYFTSLMCADCLKQSSTTYYSNCGSADSSGGDVYQGSCSLIVSKSSGFLFDESVVVVDVASTAPAEPPPPSTKDLAEPPSLTKDLAEPPPSLRKDLAEPPSSQSKDNGQTDGGHHKVVIKVVISVTGSVSVGAGIFALIFYLLRKYCKYRYSPTVQSPLFNPSATVEVVAF